MACEKRNTDLGVASLLSMITLELQRLGWRTFADRYKWSEIGAPIIGRIYMGFPGFFARKHEVISPYL